MAQYLEVSAKTVRHVWATVSRNPRLTVRGLAKQLNHSPSTIHNALHRLRDAGYIQFTDRACNARTIIVPLIILDRTA